MRTLGHYVLLAIFAASAFAAEGVVIVEDVDDLLRGVKRKRMIAVSSDGARIDAYQDGRKTTILYDLPTETLRIVDHERRIYREFSERDAARMNKQLSSHAGAAEKQQDQLIREAQPEHRAHLEQLMRGERGGMGAAAESSEREPLKFEKTTETEEIDGRLCTWLEASRNDQLVVRACAVAPETFDLDGKRFAPLVGAARLMERLSPGDAVQQTLPARDRIPLRLTVFVHGAAALTIEHQGIRKQEIPREIFEPPAGYQMRQTFGFAY